VGTHQNVIEINGKRYDASTGRTISASQKAHQVVDGFIRKPGVKHPKPAAHPTSHAHTQPHHTKHHQTQRSKTLMRSAVSKPSLIVESAEPRVEATSTFMPADSKDRIKRAERIRRSGLISKFGSVQHMTVTKRIEPLSVKAAPSSHHHQTKHHAHAPQSNPAQEHFNRAMAKAHAHEEQPLKKPSKSHHRLAKHLGVSQKTINMAASTIAALLLIGFFGYQNIPNISMRVAASRAGFDASLPSYSPNGFSMKGPIEYGPGHITLNFRSNSDDRNFQLVQTVSNWNSTALIDNFLASNNKTYQTYQDKGRTVYIYDGTNATWVSGGIWYQIVGDSSLNNEQLLQIANSI